MIDQIIAQALGLIKDFRILVHGMAMQ